MLCLRMSLRLTLNGTWMRNHVQDKAVKRFLVRNMVESAAVRDLKEQSAYESM